MAGEMYTDAATLAGEAANFDRIAVDLQGVMATVEAYGADLAAYLAGQPGGAGPAAQAALQRYNAAAHQQNQQLIEIAQKIHVSGVQYTAADEENFHLLESQMNI